MLTFILNIINLL